MKNGKKITFTYIDNTNCCIKEFKQCCCQCENHVKVLKHCCHSPRKEKCVCNEELGFYICLLWHEMERADGANLSGTHGMCECFVQRRDM